MNIASLFRMGVFLIWIVVVALIILIVMRASRGSKTRNLVTLTIVVGIFAVLFSVVSAGLFFIPSDQIGVVNTALAGGVRPEPLQPGLKWVVPFVENVRTYPTSRQTYTMSIVPNEGQKIGDDAISARTLDGQEVIIDASVIYAIDPKLAVQVHKQWQDRYAEELVRPQSRGAIRDAASQFRVEEVVSTKRGLMTAMISEKLAEKLQENGLVLIDFVLRNITFSPEYSASIEQKQIAEQQAQQAKLVVEQKKQEAEQARQQAQGIADAAVISAKGAAEARIIQSEAEKTALDLLNEAIANHPDLLSYLYINKIAPNIQVMLLPGGNSPFIYSLPNMQSGAAYPGLQLEPTPTPQVSP
jgi:regulator of protease activity HflC (stomatin/prohibitin superfamily)